MSANDNEQPVEGEPAPAEKPKVVPLRPGLAPASVVATEPNQQTIELLEQALERARNGHAVGVAIIELHTDDMVNTTWGGYWRKYLLIGGLEYLKHQTCTAIDAEDAADEEDDSA